MELLDNPAMWRDVERVAGREGLRRFAEQMRQVGHVPRGAGE